MPINDITPRDRSIRNIPLPPNHRRPLEPTPPQESPRVMLPPKRRSRLWVWILLVAAACVVGGLLLSTVFEHATITITPKTFVVSTPQTLVALPGGPSGTFVYQTLAASETASTSVAANGTQQVSLAATGVVTIYNDYSTAPQELVATTRLSTADGNIYRLKTTTTVPGATQNADGTLAPSSVTASVYADKPGAAYNTTGPESLNIVGFKDDPRYTKFPVQSEGSFSGGLVGNEPAIAPADLANAQSTLQQKIDASIRAAASTQIPDGFIAVNGSLGITYSDLTQTPAANNTVVLTQGATATLVMVRSSDAAVSLAKQVVSGYSDEPVLFADPTAVTLSLPQNTASTTGPLTLTVGGTPTLVWQFDQQALAQALLGKQKSQFQAIVNTFEPAIAKAQATIRPFWKGTFPTDPKKMSVEVSP